MGYGCGRLRHGHCGDLYRRALCGPFRLPGGLSLSASLPGSADQLQQQPDDEPGNDGEESHYAVDIAASIRLLWVFAAVFRYGFKAIKLLIRLKNGKKPKDTDSKEINTFNRGEVNMAHPIDNLMNITMDKIKEMVDVNTIVGTPITAEDGTLIIPVSKVSYGFASGGSDLPTKNEKKDLFGGGSGAGVTIQPIAFLTVYKGNVRLISVGGGDGLDKIMGMVPDVVDKVKGFFKKDKKTEIDVTDDFSEITVDDVDI